MEFFRLSVACLLRHDKNGITQRILQATDGQANPEMDYSTAWHYRSMGSHFACVLLRSEVHSEASMPRRESDDFSERRTSRPADL